MKYASSSSKQAVGRPASQSQAGPGGVFAMQFMNAVWLAAHCGMKSTTNWLKSAVLSEHSA